MTLCNHVLPKFSIILLVVVFVEGGLSCLLVEVMDSLVCCCLGENVKASEFAV